MVGADNSHLAALEAVRPFFELMGKRVIHCGGPGMFLNRLHRLLYFLRGLTLDSSPQ